MKAGSAFPQISSVHELSCHPGAGLRALPGCACAPGPWPPPLTPSSYDCRSSLSCPETPRALQGAGVSHWSHVLSYATSAEGLEDAGARSSQVCGLLETAP